MSDYSRAARDASPILTIRMINRRKMPGKSRRRMRHGPGPSSHPFVRPQGTLNAYGFGEGTLLVAGYRYSDGEPAAYSSSGADDMVRRATDRDGNPLKGPDLAAVTDESPSLPGILGSSTYSGSVTRLNGTSVAAPDRGTGAGRRDRVRRFGRYAESGISLAWPFPGPCWQRPDAAAETGRSAAGGFRAAAVQTIAPRGGLKSRLAPVTASVNEHRAGPAHGRPRARLSSTSRYSRLAHGPGLPRFDRIAIGILRDAPRGRFSG